MSDFGSNALGLSPNGCGECGGVGGIPVADLIEVRGVEVIRVGHQMWRSCYVCARPALLGRRAMREADCDFQWTTETGEHECGLERGHGKSDGALWHCCYMCPADLWAGRSALLPSGGER